MTRNIKRAVVAVFASILVVAMLLLCVACEPPKDPTTITLSEQAITIGVGDSKRVRAEVSDGSDVVWSSSDDSVATVSAAGVVRGVGAGSATITATANGVSESCSVTVQDITISLDKSELTLDIETESKKSATLVATIKNGSEVLDEEVVWSSSDNEVATVDQNGTVTAVAVGSATITAKRSQGNATATCQVTVGWENKPSGYVEIGFAEQNKATTNVYGIWNDQGWEFGNTVIYKAWSADSENSMAGKVFIDYEVLSTMKDEYQAAIQLTLRSSKATGDEGAMLEVGYFYTLSFDITSSVSGTIHANDYAVNGQVAGLEDVDYIFEVEAGVTKHIEVLFAHYDDGRIHDTTDYSNVESALHLLLGSLEGRVQVTIDNLQWVKGEQAPERPGGYTPPAPVVTVPDLSDVEDVALNINAENAVAGEGNSGSEVYNIVDNGQGKSYTIDYSGTWSATYSHIVVPIPETVDVANSNMFSVKIKNESDHAITLRFDIAGTAYDNGTNPSSRDCAISAVASKGTPKVDLAWDGTALTVDPGVEAVLYITFENTSDAGIPSELLVYFDTVWEASSVEHSGKVTLSQFKFTYWEEPDDTPEIDVPAGESVAISEFVNSTNGNYVLETADEGKSYHVTYSDVDADGYANISANIGALAENRNTFSVKIRNNGQASATIRIDICGSNAITVGANSASRYLNLNMVANGGSGVRTDLEWDGSYITIASGEEVTVVITYDNAHAEIGAPVELLFFIDSAMYGDTNTYNGDLTIGEFKFESAN